MNQNRGGPEIPALTFASEGRPAPTVSVEQADAPEQTPRAKRRIHLSPRHWPGLLVLFAVPVLALLGVLGPRQATARDRSESAEVEARFPALAHHGRKARLVVEIHNTGTEAIRRPEVYLSREYLDAFVEVRSTPQAGRISEGYVVAAPALEPGGRTAVHFELEPEEAGTAAGELRVLFDGRPVGTVELRTFVFP